MIKSIRWENIYNLVESYSWITGMTEVFSQKPDDNATPSWNYTFLSVVSDIANTKSQIWYIMKTARVSFTVVCKRSFTDAETPERILCDIVDAITNEIVYQWCDKVNVIDGFYIQSILDDTKSPIFFADNRYYIVKDYIFNYICVE